MKTRKISNCVGENKKTIEYRSLNAAKSELTYLKSLVDVSLPNQEKPDFVFIDNNNNRIGIEHFCIDISMGSRKDSGTKKYQSTTISIYEKYRKNILEQENDALSDMEHMLNCLVKDWQKFNYSTFCNNFKRVFDEHYFKVEEYKANSNLSNIGFLIEFLVPNLFYKVSNRGEALHIQELNDFPITEEMWQIMKDSLDALDFIILDTNQFARKKDSVLLVDRIKTPKIISEFAPPLKGENGKVTLMLKKNRYS